MTQLSHEITQTPFVFLNLAGSDFLLNVNGSHESTHTNNGYKEKQSEYKKIISARIRKPFEEKFGEPIGTPLFLHDFFKANI